jgi:dimethylaniline monooxygenase (N-oxide forming)
MLQLVSSKYLTTFSDFRCPKDDPDFLSTAKFCSYLEEYATNFELWPHIELLTEVISVRRREHGGHVIECSKDGTKFIWECDAVAVCSGLHVDPYIPKITGIENVPLVLHSSEFKRRSDFGIDKHVMVLGVGETGMDLSYLAITSPTKSVTICHRDGFYYAPKVTPTMISRISLTIF